MKRSDDDTCDLCGLFLRSGAAAEQEFDGRPYRFCCQGCRMVFTILMEASAAPDPARFRETELYAQCRAAGVIPSPEGEQGIDFPAESPNALPGRSAAEVTQPASAASAHLPLTLSVSGMWCPACAWLVDHILLKTPGIVDASCNFSTDRLSCRYDPAQTSPREIVAAIKALGYEASPPEQVGAGGATGADWIRLIVCALLTMNVMMLSFALYAGFWTRFSPDSIYKISLPILLMASIVFFYGGWHIHRNAWIGLISGAPGMEALISVGASSAFFLSLYHFAAGSIHLYFDTAAMLITLVLVGNMMERKSKDRIQEALSAFFALMPKKVRRCSTIDPRGRYVAVEQLAEGDRFRIRTGEVVPADGRIEAGRGLVDEASLTGEALPVAKSPGHRLKSGARVLQGEFVVAAEAVGSNSTLGQMILIIERALEGKTPLEGRTDRLLRWFVPGILVLASATGLVWFWSGLDLQAAIMRAVTVTVISCPCALGIAIPLARVAGISVAGKKGILVRDFSAFEKAPDIDTVLFDKTGTLTQGSWELHAVEPLQDWTPERILAFAATLEKNSNHPIAAAILDRARNQNIAILPAADIETFENGIRGRVAGRHIRIGSQDFVSQNYSGRDIDPVMTASTSLQFASRVFMTVDDALAARLVFGDRLRPGARGAVEGLRARRLDVALVSGDGDDAVGRVGAELGIADVRGGLQPSDKAVRVRKLRAGGRRVAMVGDGVNDAPALAESDLAVAIHSGSHLGRELADITLMRADPEQLLAFFELAGRVNRKIHQNLTVSFIYNLVSIPIAVSGLLNPLVAVSAMLLSSLSVTTNTYRLIRKNP